MRNRFDEQLFELNREIIEVGSACEEVIANASNALTTGNLELAKSIKETGQTIDQMERDIERRCIKLLLHQQPVAHDLHLISAALKMITDMERIGDQAEDIAEIVTYLDGYTFEGIGIVEDMAKEIIDMVTSSIDAFVKKDMSLAEKVIRQDDVVDDYFLKIKSDIISMIKNHSADGELALDMLMVAKYFERIGDHAVNIAEWVIYSVTGKHKEV